MTPYSCTIRDVMDLAEFASGNPAWGAYCAGSATGGYIVDGCVPYGTYSRGPRKGKPRYSHPKATDRRTIIVTTDQVQAAASAYESCGRCWQCKGSGKEWSGWSAETGTRQRTCRRCQGTGKAPRKTQEAPC